jgi:hypothetical protein
MLNLINESDKINVGLNNFSGPEEHFPTSKAAYKVWQESLLRNWKRLPEMNIEMRCGRSSRSLPILCSLLDGTATWTEKRMTSWSNSRRRLSVFSLLKPDIFEGFRSVTLAGACFKDSLLYRHWSKLGVGFVPAANHNLRYEQHENADELTILWAIEQNWSKWLMRQGEGQVATARLSSNYRPPQNDGRGCPKGV